MNDNLVTLRESLWLTELPLRETLKSSKKFSQSRQASVLVSRWPEVGRDIYAVKAQVLFQKLAVLVDGGAVMVRIYSASPYPTAHYIVIGVTTLMSLGNLSIV